MKLGFIGTGNMAGAIMGGVIKSNVFKPEEIIGADLFAPGRERAQKEYGINVTADNKEEVIIDAFTNPIKDAEFKVTIEDVQPVDQKTYTSSIYSTIVNVKSYLDEPQDVILEMEIPECLHVDTANFPEDYEFISLEDNLLRLKVPDVTKEGKEFIIPFGTLDLDMDLLEDEVSIMAKIITERNNE